MPTVAIGLEFLEAFARIPKAQQRKVREFTEKFRLNPTSSAINYEKIHCAKDDKVRTVRIGLDYRAVVIQPAQGDIYMLVWVDHHDDAMEWTRNRTFEINPATGSLQIVNTEAVEKVAVPALPAPTQQPRLLDAFSDEVLISFGVPQVFLPAVRAVRGSDELTAMGHHLPAEAAEALVWLADGIPVEEVRSAVTVASKTVDTGNFEKALEHPDTRRRFVTVDSQYDLTSMLNAPLAKWRIFLHPTQERLVRKERYNGPACVLGGAGTGKTVVAMHRARFLASKIFTAPTDKVLFTTFTANLARDIRQNLKSLCGPEIDRIEVLHLDSWAMTFLKTQGYAPDVASETEIDECWRSAIAVSDAAEWPQGFLEQEWDRVVRANGVRTREEYLKVSRVGRGRTVSRPDRARIWKVFEEFQAALKAANKVEWLDVITSAREYLGKQGQILPYRAVVADEVQDFPAEKIRLLRAIVPEGPNDLFLVGDPFQRIYGEKVVLGKCGVNIRGRSSKLKINYRTTEQIRGWAVGILNGVAGDDMDGGADNIKGYMSLMSGPKPEVHAFQTLEDERVFLFNTITELLQNQPAEEICLVARTGPILKKHYLQPLAEKGINLVLIEKSAEQLPAESVRLANMHRVKGLEFPTMIIAGAGAGTLPLAVPALETDQTAQADHIAQERCLLFVAATRARDRLIVTYSGPPSSFLVRAGAGNQV